MTTGLILLATLPHRLAEDVVIVRRRAGLRGDGFAGRGAVRPETVELFGMLERSLEALALLRKDMNDDRTYPSGHASPSSGRRCRYSSAACRPSWGWFRRSWRSKARDRGTFRDA